MIKKMNWADKDGVGDEMGLCGDSNASDVMNDMMSDLSHGRGGVFHYKT
jgi:hypothetical protein